MGRNAKPAQCVDRHLEVTEAPRYERLGIAVDVWNLYHDFSDEAKSLGYSPPTAQTVPAPTGCWRMH